MNRRRYEPHLANRRPPPLDNTDHIAALFYIVHRRRNVNRRRSKRCSSHPQILQQDDGRRHRADDTPRCKVEGPLAIRIDDVRARARSIDANLVRRKRCGWVRSLGCQDKRMVDEDLCVVENGVERGRLRKEDGMLCTLVRPLNLNEVSVSVD